MDIDELHVGQQVRVIIWENSRPEHWSEEMDEWQGMIVTVSDLDHPSEYVYIDDDDGQWTWHPWDFEDYHRIPKNNPNMVYRRYKHDEMMRKLRLGIRHKEEIL